MNGRRPDPLWLTLSRSLFGPFYACTRFGSWIHLRFGLWITSSFRLRTPLGVPPSYYGPPPQALDCEIVFWHLRPRTRESSARACVCSCACACVRVRAGVGIVALVRACTGRSTNIPGHPVMTGGEGLKRQPPRIYSGQGAKLFIL